MYQQTYALSHMIVICFSCHLNDMTQTSAQVLCLCAYVCFYGLQSLYTFVYIYISTAQQHKFATTHHEPHHASFFVLSFCLVLSCLVLCGPVLSFHILFVCLSVSVSSIPWTCAEHPVSIGSSAGKAHTMKGNADVPGCHCRQK